METYHDISLEIRRLGEGQFETRLRGDRQAEQAAPFIPPCLSEIDIATALDRTTREQDREFMASCATEKPPVSDREIGNVLFEALFPGDVRRVFDQSRSVLDDVLPDGTLRGMRIRLRLDLADEAVCSLAALPWELLYDPLNRDFYGQGRRRLLVRHLAAPHPVPPMALQPPLRILAVSSEPRSAAPLALETEMKALCEAFEDDNRVSIIPLANAKRDTLLSALRRHQPHILHFMGHGGVDPKSGGHLLFEDKNQGIDRINGELLSVLLNDFSLRLVVLNACRTAQMPRLRGQTPFMTVGAALSLEGIPAVVAMQAPITDAAALHFSRTFYDSLASGDPVDVAVGEGRREIYALRYGDRTPEWAAPVLFLRSHDGRVFDLPRREVHPERPAEETRVMNTTPNIPDNSLLLGIRSLEPLGDRPDPTLNLTRHFEGRPIREHSLWREAVYPELKAFLQDAAATRRPLVIDFAAHLSIAFAAGYILQAKSGLDITLRQRLLKGGFKDWNPEDGPLPDGPFWQQQEDLFLNDAGTDVAVAVGITWPALDDVSLYLERSELPVRRILPAILSPEPSNTAVHNGAHALALAQSLALRIRSRTPSERLGTLHLFLSAPNAVAFYLGQLAHGLGRIQLYEYDIDSGTPGAYQPSLVLP